MSNNTLQLEDYPSAKTVDDNLGIYPQDLELRKEESHRKRQLDIAAEFVLDDAMKIIQEETKNDRTRTNQ